MESMVKRSRKCRPWNDSVSHAEMQNAVILGNSCINVGHSTVFGKAVGYCLDRNGLDFVKVLLLFDFSVTANIPSSRKVLLADYLSAIQ